MPRSPADGSVGEPQRPQKRCVRAHSTSWTARPAAIHSASLDRPKYENKSSAEPYDGSSASCGTSMAHQASPFTTPTTWRVHPSSAIWSSTNTVEPITCTYRRGPA